ncbi:hypothetical protein HDU99_004793, partial [Rhizoclosmatium hyalinum]
GFNQGVIAPQLTGSESNSDGAFNSIDNELAELTTIYSMEMPQSYLGLNVARTSPFVCFTGTGHVQHPSFVPTNECDIEDPDLLPTYADWELVFNYLTKDGTVYPQAASFDAEAILSNYFHKPAELR